MATRQRADAANKVAVVLSGAGARGAFQAGALAELLPALVRDKLRPTVWLGTSAGSINAVLWGAVAHLDAAEAADDVCRVWRQMSDEDVFRSLKSPLSWGPRLWDVTGAVVGRGPGAESLLDTSPLARTADKWLDSAQLAVNVRTGVLDAVGVVATRMPAESDGSVPGAASGRSVLFLHERARGTYRGDKDRAIDVARSPLQADHVLASAAIPVAFPAVRIERPEDAAGWYTDGGVRLNTPLLPAIRLGATKIVLVSATATTYPLPPRPGDISTRRNIADAAAQVLHSSLADRTTEDLRALRRANRLVGQARMAGVTLRDNSRRPYREIEVMVVSPPPGEMAGAAAEIFQAKTGGFGRLKEYDNWLLGKGIRIAGNTAGREELLSYLFFDETYFDRGIEIGQKAAADALDRGFDL